MRIRLLGTIEVEVGGVTVPLGPRQRRLVLGVLAWYANRPVSVDQLVAVVWPEDPPRSAVHAVRVAVSQLRSQVAIETHGSGYLLRVDPMLVDAHQFTALVSRSRAVEDAERLALLDEALALWRGPLLGDGTLGAGIEETRLGAVEDRMDVLLRLGRHRDVIDELLVLVDANPTRERLVGQLMLALYRSGQASRALEVFRRTREHLAEELGIDPGSDLQRLELAILRNEGLDPVVAPALVGRRHELAQLTGNGVVLVEGPAGIGKTALLDEFARRLARPVLRGRGVTDEGAPAYWPWRQVFRQWLDSAGAEATRVLGDAADRIARIIPEFGDPPDLSAEERFVLFDQVTAVVRRMAAGGMVIVIDDLHWADPASLLLFGHLARGVQGVPLLLVGAFRPYELRQAPRGEETLAEITRQGARRLELSGLSVEEVAEQLSAELGRPCDVEEAATVARRTGGNPLFVREIGRLRRTDPKASITHVPTGARDAIRQYLSVLSPPCRALLSAASVLSVDIDPVTLAAVTSTSVEEVLDALDEAAAAAVVVRNRFAHDLVRDSLMLDLSPAERGRIHLRAAEYLESGTGHLAQIAHHRLAALPLGSPAAAREAAVRAAELAMSQLAYEDAVRLYDQALAGASDLDLLIGKATAQYLAYDVEPARRTCEEAANLARRVGDAVGLARAALVMPDQADPAWLGTILPWCDEALAGLPAGDGILRAKLLALRVTMHTALGETVDADRLSDLCLEMAERLDDPVTLVAALRARQHANSGPDGNHVRLALGDRMLGLGDSAAMWGHLWRFDALMQLGRVVDADLELDLLEPVVARLDSPLAHWHLHRSRAAILHGRGRFADAHRALDQARRLAELGNNPHGVAATELSRTFLGAMTSSSLSQATAEVLRRGFGPSPLSRVALATIYVAVDDLDAAREVYRTLPPLTALTVPAWYQLSTRAQYARIAAALEDVEAASVAYDLLLPHAHLHMTTGAGVTLTSGSVHFCLGVTAAVCGRADAAVEHLRSAVAVNDAAGLDPHTAQARYRLAVLTRDRTEAQAAHDAAVRLGMPRLRAQTESLLEDVRA